jgi:UDP-N-acetylglucosamine--N-acetylmuramyl-(pentapeptide) pyrophosphoryl-undecaprenol N-acetylglucosamine transferase
MSTLLVMAGGTGGHVFPALAVAKYLRDRGVEVVWLGTRSGLEARTIPAAGFDIEWINIRGARGKGLLGWLRTPFLVLAAMVQTIGVVRRRRPRAMLGMGGFVAGPGGLVSWLMRRPLLIHEANALAGLTNQLLARIATRVMTGFPGTFGRYVAEEYVGNPVRREIAALSPPRERLEERSGPLRVLVIGGSQGARTLNLELPRLFADAVRLGCALDIRHQSGAGQLEEVEECYAGVGLSASVEAFIEDMAEAYGWADLVLCRAGAMTVAEVSAAGLAAIFVPFPFAVGDHQTANANYLAQRGAAHLVPENQLAASLPALLLESCANREHLIETAEKARSLAKPDATAAVADICMETLNA